MRYDAVGRGRRSRYRCKGSGKCAFEFWRIIDCGFHGLGGFGDVDACVEVCVFEVVDC